MKAELTAIIEPAPEGGYWAICPEVPGANGQGETVEETKRNLIEAIEPSGDNTASEQFASCSLVLLSDGNLIALAPLPLIKLLPSTLSTTGFMLIGRHDGDYIAVVGLLSCLQEDPSFDACVEGMLKPIV